MSDGMKRWRCLGHHTHTWDDKKDTSSEPAVVEAPTRALATAAYAWHGYLSPPDKYEEITAQPVSDDTELSESKHWELTWRRSMGPRRRFRSTASCTWSDEINAHAQMLDNQRRMARK